MRKTIKLTESDIHQIVERVINEVSTDTAYSATNKAYERWKQCANQFGPNDARTQRAKDQYINIKNGYDHKRRIEVGVGNNSERRAINRDVRNKQIDNGELKYVKGTGWRKNVQNNDTEIGESIIKRAVRESVKKVMGEAYQQPFYNEFGTHGGYTGEDAFGRHGWVSNEEAEMRAKFQKLKNWGRIGYDYFEDWKRDGYPHADEV